MITFCQSTFPIKENQNVSENVAKKMEEFTKRENRVFWYTYNMGNIIRNRLIDIDEYNDINETFIRCSWMINDFMMSKEFDKFSKYTTIKSILDDAYEYISYLKSQEGSEDVYNIRNAIKFFESRKSENLNFSYSCIMNIARKKNIDEDEGVNILKSLFFAKDFYDIKSLLVLRKRLYNSYVYREYLNGYIGAKNINNDIFSVLFNDYMILDFAIKFGSKLSRFEFDFNDGFVEIFDYICMCIYCRFIVEIYILVGQVDASGFFDENRLEVELSKTYHRINMFIYNALYKYLSIQEHILFMASSIIDDISLHIQTFYDVDRLKISSSMSGAISRDSGHADYSEIIDEICIKADKIWEKSIKDGTEIGHIDMINSFKKMKKYSEYFQSGAFCKKLRKKIIELCENKEYKVIVGVHIAARKGRKKGLTKQAKNS